MEGNISIFTVKRFQHFKAVVLLCLLCSLVMSACTSPPPTIPIPTIVPSRPCDNLAPEESLQLAVTGISGDDIVYSWTAGAGGLTPPDGPVVKFTAPNMGGDVIIRVEVRKDGQSSAGVLTCKVSGSAVLLPSTPASTPILTLTPTPATEQSIPLTSTSVSTTDEPTATIPVTGDVSIEITEAESNHVSGKVGTASYCNKNYRVVIYAKTDIWYIQPNLGSVHLIGSTCDWDSNIRDEHPWKILVAFLVSSNYYPPAEISEQSCPPNLPDARVLASICKSR